jgi:hypothetical protein
MFIPQQKSLRKVAQERVVMSQKRKKSSSEEESDSENKLTKYQKHMWPTMQYLNISHSTRSFEKLRKKPKGPIGSAAGVLQTQQQGKLLGGFPVSIEKAKEDKDPVWNPCHLNCL